jgi:hypothetical protein
MRGLVLATWHHCFETRANMRRRKRRMDDQIGILYQAKNLQQIQKGSDSLPTFCLRLQLPVHLDEIHMLRDCRY